MGPIGADSGLCLLCLSFQRSLDRSLNHWLSSQYPAVWWLRRQRPLQISSLASGHQLRAQGPERTRLSRQRGGGRQKLGMSLSPRRGIFAPLQYNLGQIT